VGTVRGRMGFSKKEKKEKKGEKILKWKSKRTADWFWRRTNERISFLPSGPPFFLV